MILAYYTGALVFLTPLYTRQRAFVYFIVKSLCHSLPDDIDQQMYIDTRSYIFTIMTGAMCNTRTSNDLQIRLAAYFHPQSVQK